MYFILGAFKLLFKVFFVFLILAFFFRKKRILMKGHENRFVAVCEKD